MPGQRPADGADLHRAGVFSGEGRRGLGQAVALEDGQSDAAVEVAEPLAERRAAGDGVRAPAAEGVAQPAVDEPREDRVLGAHRERRPASAESRPRDQAMATSAARSKILPRPSAVAFWDAVLKTFSNTRGTASTNVGRNSPRSRTRLRMSALWPSRTRALTAPDLDDAGEHVRQRQEQQRRAASSPANSSSSSVDRHAQLGHEVAVGEHAALGPARRARGVDDGGQVEGRGRRTPRLEVGVGDVGAEPGQHAHGVVVDRPDVAQLLEVGAHLGDPGQVGRSLGHDGAGARVAQDVPDLLGRRRLVDRHRHGAGEPDGVVEQRPLVPGPGDQRHPVARLDAGGDQSLGDVAHLGRGTPRR